MQEIGLAITISLFLVAGSLAVVLAVGILSPEFVGTTVRRGGSEL